MKGEVRIRVAGNMLRKGEPCVGGWSDRIKDRSHARSHLSFMPRALCRFPASGGANQHSSSAAASSSSEEPSVDTFKAPVAPKSNDDFRKMFLKQ
uniref:Lsm_interact domain-containing protein n=1 Tax=Mesocestoides corti TaxID=53468 RepID=A0A5K3FY70_MESCO